MGKSFILSVLPPSPVGACPSTVVYKLRLYRGSEPGETIETRHIDQGSITLGRDPENDWVVSDPDRTLSRRHCDLIVKPDGIALCAMGVNGAYLHGERIQSGVEVMLDTPCVLTIGNFRLAVDEAEAEVSNPARNEKVGGSLVAEPGPSTLSASETGNANRSLLEAFCDGAGLDSSLLAGEEPDEVMLRAGAIYRHTVVAVSELMVERDRARALYDLERTKIGGAGNNLFKWASSQRLVGDLLATAPAGFLSGPDALQSSLKAIRRHFKASQVAMHSCFRVLTDMLSPDLINNEARSNAPTASTKDQANVSEFAKLHAEMVKQLGDTIPAFLEEPFALAYEAADSALERSGL